MPDETARHFRRVQHSRLLGSYLSRTEPRHCAFTSLAPDAVGTLELARIARRCIPIVTLHVVAGLGEQHAAHAVAGGGKPLEEAMRVAVYAHAAMAADTRAFRIRDA